MALTGKKQKFAVAKGKGMSNKDAACSPEKRSRYFSDLLFPAGEGEERASALADCSR